MSRGSFFNLCDKLRAFITKKCYQVLQSNICPKTGSIYNIHLLDEGRTRKRVWVSQKHCIKDHSLRHKINFNPIIASKYIQLAYTKEELQYPAACFYENMVSHSVLVLLMVPRWCHVGIGKSRENPTDYISRKDSQSLYCLAVADHKYCCGHQMARQRSRCQNVFKFIVKLKIA